MKILKTTDSSFIYELEGEEFEDEFKDLKDNIVLINEKGIFIKDEGKRFYIGSLKGCDK